MTVLAHMVEHLSDSDELNSCIKTVLPSVVPMLGDQDVDIRAGSASTILTFLNVGRDKSPQTVAHISGTALPGVVPMMGYNDTNVSDAATNMILKFLKVGTGNHLADIVLPGVVPLLAANKRHVSENSASTIQEFTKVLNWKGSLPSYVLKKVLFKDFKTALEDKNLSKNQKIKVVYYK